MDISEYGYAQYVPAILMCLVAVGGWQDVKIGYGKHLESLSKIELPPKLGWFIFESPNIFVGFYFLFKSNLDFQSSDTLAFLLFLIHYINRDLIYPLRMSSKSKGLPVEVVASAFFYTFCNSYLQATTHLTNPSQKQLGILEIIGVVCFAVGMWANIQCDKHLAQLKDKNNGNYAIPTWGPFAYVTSAHYTCEIFEWFGFYLVSGRFSSFLFFALTLIILTPRALKTHKWYHQKFNNFPKDRKSLVPFVY